MADREAGFVAALRRAPRAPAAGPASGPHASDSARSLHAGAAERLLDHLAPVRMHPGWVVASGEGAALERGLRNRFPKARIALCLSPRRVTEDGGPRRHRRLTAVAASPNRLPFSGNSADLVVSSLVLHWFPDPFDVLLEMHRVLRPGGLAAFGTFGPDTLRELRESWSAVDNFSHVIEFIDMHEIGDKMMRAGFTDVVMDSERLSVTWPDLSALLRDLRGLGTGNPAPGRMRGLTTPARIGALERAYEVHRSQGRLPATLELVHGHGWKREARTDVPFDGTVRQF